MDAVLDGSVTEYDAAVTSADLEKWEGELAALIERFG
jgi:hypothetical protein